MRIRLVACLFLSLFTMSVFAAPKAIIAQYFGIWVEESRHQQWEQKFRQDTPFTKLNRLYISFCKIVKAPEGGFTIQFDGETDRAVALMNRMRAVNPEAEIFVSLGGDGGPNAFGGAAQDPQFAERVRNFLLSYHLQGIDIDWEIGLKREPLSNLISSLSPVLHQAGLKLTLAVWPFVNSAYDMSVLAPQLDQMNIMSYGQMRGLEGIVQQFVNAGFPIEKLIGGIEVENPYREGGPDTLGKDGTITQKANYARQHGLAGMMSWRLDNDYPEDSDLNYPTYRGALQLYEAMNQ